MTTEPEYPIISTDNLKPGQQYRHGPCHEWHTADSDGHAPPFHLAAPPTVPWSSLWVEAKPAPFQVGDRVRYKDDYSPTCDIDLTATVKYAGENWLIVQVDGSDGYEDSWGIRSVVHHVEESDPNQ